MKQSVVFLLSLCFVSCILASCNAPGAGVERENTLQKILHTKNLRVAYIHYPPSTYKDPDSGKVKGLFVDMLEEIVRQLDPSIKIEYEETAWADFSAALNSGRVDLSIAGTFTTIPRAKVVAFTNPIVYLGRSAIVKKGDTRFSPDKGPEQFDRPGIKVGVVNGEGSQEYVKANFKNQDNIVVFSGSDLSQCLAAVSAGQVDVGMSDALETQKYAKAHADVIDLYAENPYDLNPIAWAVRQDDLIWRDFLNTAINMLEASGQIGKWETKYDFRWTHPNTVYRPR